MCLERLKKETGTELAGKRAGRWGLRGGVYCACGERWGCGRCQVRLRDAAAAR